MSNKAGLITLILFPFILWVNWEIIFSFMFFSGNLQFKLLHILSGIEFIVPVCVVLMIILIFLKIFSIKIPKYIVVFMAAFIWIVGSYLRRTTKSYSSGFSYSAFKGQMIDKGVLTEHGELVALTSASYQFTAIMMSLVIYLLLKKWGLKNEK